jgi:60 kDa SS-A/Ro ribonucleoprotein
MTNIGLIKPMSAAAKLVKERLSDATYLKKSRIHPLAVLTAFKVYSRGAGLKGSLTWTPVPTVLSVLNEAFYATFGNVTPAGKPMLIALDVSGSMAQLIDGSAISSAESVAAMSLVWAATEPEVHIFGFAHEFRELGIRKGMDLETAIRKAHDQNFGSTYVSLAYEYAIQHKLKVGGFVVMTDNETNRGPHAALRLKAYRERFVPDARSVVAATASNPFTVNDPNDKWGLDVVGFDTSVPNVVTSFIRGTPAEVSVDDEAAD